MNPSQRLHSLDNLRAIMMWLGIVLHVAIIHIVGYFPLPWRDPQTSMVANYAFHIIHTFRMPVFFILAGFFVALLVERRGFGGMLKHRLRRIGLPFVIFWPFLFVAMMNLIGRFLQLMMPAGADISLGAAPAVGMPPPNTMHMWFIYYLLWLCLLGAALGKLGAFFPLAFREGVAQLVKPIGASWWGGAVLAAPLIVAGLSYRTGVVQASNSFIPEAAPLVYHGAFMWFGWYLYRHRVTLVEVYVRRCWIYLAAGLAFFLVAQFLFQNAGIQTSMEEAFLASATPSDYLGFARLAMGTAYNIASWCWSFAAIGLFVRYLPQQNRFLSYLSDSSYWVYLVHMPCTIGFGVLLYNTELGALAKMAANIAATTLTCIVSYQLMVRHTPIGTLLNGRRREVKALGRFPASRLAKTWLAVGAVFICYLAVSEIKFTRDGVPTRSNPPQLASVPADVQEFLEQLGKAYGSADSAEVAGFLANDFLHQGMDKAAFLKHLKVNQPFLGKLDIKPVNFDGVRMNAYAVSARGALSPSLHLLPLHAGAMLDKASGAWKLRGNQRQNEVALYRNLSGVLADFTPADLDLYRRLIPNGYDMPIKPLVRLAVADWREVEAPAQPFRSVRLSILVNKGDTETWHVIAMPGNDWLEVEAGKTIGFAQTVADIGIKRSLSDKWRINVSGKDGQLADIAFDPIVMTKTTDFTPPVDLNEWVAFGRDGMPVKVMLTELAPPKRPRTGFGWMTVEARTSPWKELLPAGSRGAAISFDMKGPRKQHVLSLTDAEVPSDIRAMLDRYTADWARADMDAILANYHPAFMLTNQKDLAALRRQFSLSRQYEWKVKSYRDDGSFGYLAAEVHAGTGTILVNARLLREKGRWLFYGDGGSRKDAELALRTSATVREKAGSTGGGVN